MNCGACSFTDGYCYTSLPPKVKCTITDECHYYDDICNCEEVRAQKAAESASGTLLITEEAGSYKGLLNPALHTGTTDECTAIAVGCTSCLVCGDDVILTWYEGGPKICSACQKTIKFIKEKFKKELNEYEV